MKQSRVLTYNDGMSCNVGLFTKMFLDHVKGELSPQQIDELRSAIPIDTRNVYESFDQGMEIPNHMFFIDLQTGMDHVGRALTPSVFLKIFEEAYFGGDGNKEKAFALVAFKLAQYHRHYTSLERGVSKERTPLVFRTHNKEHWLIAAMIQNLYIKAQQNNESPFEYAKRFDRIEPGHGVFENVYALYYH